METREIDFLYQAFGKLVRLHREQRRDLTQEKLGRLVGLSRTSITNIEKGRQHVALHQVFALANALGVPPSALLPTVGDGQGTSWVASKLPPDTDKEITQWAEMITRE
ncbi:MAG: helix-turn-helix transcriptional regulator [Proteobacteria bacterium]|nr:helix-turn-helix transcriptional regulator [Pseudomonadota bacterium]